MPPRWRGSSRRAATWKRAPCACGHGREDSACRATSTWATARCASPGSIPATGSGCSPARRTTSHRCASTACSTATSATWNTSRTCSACRRTRRSGTAKRRRGMRRFSATCGGLAKASSPTGISCARARTTTRISVRSIRCGRASRHAKRRSRWKQSWDCSSGRAACRCRTATPASSGTSRSAGLRQTGSRWRGWSRWDSTTMQLALQRSSTRPWTRDSPRRERSARSTTWSRPMPT